MRVLLVEDDELLGDGLFTGLKQLGYTVDWVKNGIAAEHILDSEFVDVMVLDLGLPRRSGLEVLKNIRQRGTMLPVIILTAREATEDKITALDMGADDYLVKPCDLDELAARIRALHRRKTGGATALLTHGKLTVDSSSHQVKYDDKSINLPRREFAILEKLVENLGKIVSRDQLLQSIYGFDEIDSNTLEVHIHNIRKKLPLPKNYIRTIRGIGYMIEKEIKLDSTNNDNKDNDAE